MWKFPLLTWLPLPFLGIANGALREFALTPLLGEPVARPLSGLTLILIITLYVLMLRRTSRLTSPQAGLTGVVWLILTIAFEFLFGYYVAGDSWSELLSNYDITSGSFWLLVVIWIAIAPWLLLRRKTTAPPPGQGV